MLQRSPGAGQVLRPSELLLPHSPLILNCPARWVASFTNEEVRHREVGALDPSLRASIQSTCAQTSVLPREFRKFI